MKQGRPDTPAKRQPPRKTRKHGRREQQTCPLRYCEQPLANNATICPSCTDQLRTDLTSIPALAEDLAVTYTRQSRMTERASGSRAAETELPFHEKARIEADALYLTLARWTVNVLSMRALDDQGPTCRHCHHASCKLLRSARPPLKDAVSMSRWLLTNVQWLRHHDLGPELTEAISKAIRRAHKVIDRHADHWYAGTCRATYTVISGDRSTTAQASCLYDLYVQPDAVTITCPHCGTNHDVKERRRWLLKYAEEELATAHQIASAVTILGQHVTPERIRQWKHRHRIDPKDQDHDGHDLFRIGDVLELLYEHADAEASRLRKQHERSDAETKRAPAKGRSVA